MQLYSPLSHQQVNEHLANLRQEAANARLRSSLGSFLSRLLNTLKRPEAESRSAQPGASKPGASKTSVSEPGSSKPGVRHT